MSSTAPIPSLAQPHLFPGNFISTVNPPPYAHFPSVLDASTPPEGPERELWDAKREEAIGALEEQSRHTPVNGPTRSTASRYAPLNADTQWQKSTHQSSALATTILRSTHRHRSAPMMPSGLLPPPSSLAKALGDATSLQQHQFVPSNRPFHPSESSAFFDEFLETTLLSQSTSVQSQPLLELHTAHAHRKEPQSNGTAEIPVRVHTPIEPISVPGKSSNGSAALNPRTVPPDESPDPLALIPKVSKEATGGPVTPTRPPKRKADSAFPPSRVSVVISQRAPGSANRAVGLGSRSSTTPASSLTPQSSRATGIDTTGKNRKILKLEKETKGLGMPPWVRSIAHMVIL